MLGYIQSLADFEVPMVRATWFIKMTAAYHLIQTDTKIKKRVTNDPSSGKFFAC